MDAINKITIDVSDPLNTQVVHAVQEDIRSRFVEITLVRNGEPLDIPVGAVGVVGLRRPNETYVLYDTDEDGNAAVTFDGNIATCYLRQEALAMAGSMYTSVSIYSSDHTVRLTAFHFITGVDATAVPSDVIIEHDYINIFQAELDEINTLLGDLSATATTLPAGSDATASYSDGVFSFGIPQGETGGISEEEFEAGMALKAPVIVDTASGEIASIVDGAGGMDARSLVVNIEPIQNLHGYDNPWPAGGGKNLYPIAIGTESFVNNGSATHSNSNGSLVIVTNSGSSSSGVYLGSGNKFEPILNAYSAPLTVSMDIQATASGDVRIVFCGSYLTFTIGTTIQRISVTASSTATKNFNIYGVNNGATLTISNLQIESGSSATSYAPYSNVCPISGRTGLTVYRTGVNVWDEEWENGTFNTTTGVNINSGGALNQIRSKNLIPVVGGQTYSFCTPVGLNIFSQGAWTMFYDADMNIITSGLPSGRGTSGNSRLFNTGKTATMPTNAAFVKFYLTAEFGSTYKNNVSINFPSTDTDYHPYTGDSYPVSWQTEAGTVYKGTLNVLTGELTATHSLYTFTGNEGWTKQGTLEKYYSSSPAGGYLVSNGKSPTGNDHSVPIITSIGDYNLAYNSLQAEDYGICIATDKRIGITSSLYGKMTGVQICYELATHLSYQLDPQTVQMLLGANNVWSTGDTVDLTYPCDTKLYIERLTAPTEDDMVANENIPNNTYFMVGNRLYKSMAAIAAGASIVVGTNCTAMSLADALNALN